MNKKICPQCGTEFEGRENRIYCSNRCKSSAFRNGNNGNFDKTTDFETDETFSERIEKPFLTETSKMKETLLPVTIMFSPEEKQKLKIQADECGVDINTFIRVRSQMTQTNAIQLQNIIEKQKKEINELTIKLKFFDNLKQTSVNDTPGEDGVFINITNEQIDMINDIINIVDEEENEEEQEFLEENRKKFNKGIVLSVFSKGVGNLHLEHYNSENYNGIHIYNEIIPGLIKQNKVII